MHIRIALAVAFAAVLTAVCASTAQASYLRCYAYAQKVNESASWNAARTKMDIHNGVLGTSDAEYGRFIAQVLWVHDEWQGPGDPDNEWIEAGYTRGWNDDANPDNNNILTLYWTEQKYVEGVGMCYFEYKIRTPLITAGEEHWVKIRYLDGSAGYARWGVYIDGDPADAQWWYSDSQAHNHTHALQCGLENTASSGKLGSSSDHADCLSVNKSTDQGSSWTDWSGTGLTERVNEGDPYYCHGHWQNEDPDTAVWRDYRNW